MDALAGLLDGPRARGAFLLRMVMEPPWAVRIEDRAPICLMSVRRGTVCVVPSDGGEPVRLGPGDIAVVRGPDPYTVADAPGTTPHALVGPGGVCTTLHGRPLAQDMVLNVRTWGNAAHGGTSVLVGTYLLDGEISRRLLDALPPLLTIPADARTRPLLDLLDAEIAQDEPGQRVVLDRLLDLLLIAVLRAWFARPGADAPAWYRALGDPVVGTALRLLQDDPAHPWTVASLAARAGVSRAGLARRFTELVGEPPMAYLTGWRLAVAADLLRESDATVEAVARKVGYSTPFAFSAAFKRVRGVSPQEYRVGPPEDPFDLPERQRTLPRDRPVGKLTP
ncbi:AraC family transcriptional regulator [Streptomyces filamentosus]|uniref:AraC family transcriptional regulator n=4 Tax=Streptomyces TaxID=1883 RepID=A0ABY4UNY6_STRFL|nr:MULTISPECIES: AraC family transcriptional regulator [Streptomyces]EFE78771.1 NanR4 [Streptomyces filamentosus NRRL 15998]EWS95637.1 AraC family transcriptional regulator [Streptomyces filamentosus NRRL 11379]MYR82623.1 helix-turn-helix domain-containing protein [Streptomyces sp. SID5466]USC45934.1 AraC family transcriptional regulator [Streptomyces filamentosus]